LAISIVAISGILAFDAFTAYSCIEARAATTHCETEKCLRKANAWLRHDRNHYRRIVRQRTTRDATYAVRLAAAAYGLPYLKLRCIAQRESGLGAQRYPESSSGASGLMQFLGSTWRHTPFSAAGFSVWANIANALAAAQIIVHDGSARQWVTGRGCGL
jgi:hypothetical protein